MNKNQFKTSMQTIKKYVDDSIAQASIGGDVDTSGFALKSELFSKDYNDLTNKPIIPSIDGLATETYVDDAIIELEESGMIKMGNIDGSSGQLLVAHNPNDGGPNNVFFSTKAYIDSTGSISTEANMAAKAFYEDSVAIADKYANKDELFSGSYRDLTDTPNIPLKVTQLQDGANYATTTYVDSQIVNVVSGLAGVPQYVYHGAENVYKKIITTRNHSSLVIGAMSDLHTSGTDDSAISVKNACYAMNEINKYTQLDLVAVLGDIMVDHMDSVNNPGFKYVRQQLDSIIKAVPYIQLEGNHDLDEVNTTAEFRRQEYYAYIGANNVDVVTHFGNEFRNYGYKDFNNKRIRVIYLNTSDVAEEGLTTHLRISPTQFDWFLNTALDFTNKEGADDWHVIVMTHIPLNYTNSSLEKLLQILKDYKAKKSGSITVNDITLSYDFTNNKQNFICHIHGHIHNFRTEWFDDVLSITVPNACFGRNNEYGISDSYSDEVHELYGDVDKNGNQRVYEKVMATVEDTAFSVFVIDSRINNKVHVYNYGAGLHRIIDLTTKEIIEEEINHYEDIGLTPGANFINAIPLSTTVGSTAIYNGQGYKNDTYVSSSSGGDSSASGYVATGVMDYPVNNTYAHEIFILGADFDTSDNRTRIVLYTAESTMKACLAGSAINDKFIVTQLGDEYYKIEPIYSNGTPDIYSSYGSSETITGMRMSMNGIGQNLYISMKNPIVDGLDGETVQWSAYTNLVPSSIGSDKEVFNTTGYKEGTRLNSSGVEATLAKAICSGFIPYNDEDIRAYGARTENLEAGAFYICFYNAAFEKIGVIPGREFDGTNTGLTYEMIDEKMQISIDVSEVTNESFIQYITDAVYIRVSMSICSGQVFVVTLNEKLTLDEE